MRKGINQWSLPEEWDLKTCFDVARRAGFDGVELVVGEPGERSEAAAGAEHVASPLRYLGFHPYANDEFCLGSSRERIDAVRALAEEADMAIPSISTVQPFLHPLTANEPEVRARGTAALREALEMAGRVGARSLLVVPGVVTPGIPYDAALERSRACFASLIPHAEANGVVLAIENVWNGMLYSPLEFRDFVDSLDSPFVQAYVDVGNAVRTGFGEDWLRILDERVDKVHFCNFRAEVGNLTGFTRHLLDGDVDWPGVMDALEAVGYDGWITAEVTPPAPYHPEKAVRDIASTMDWIVARGAPDGAGGQT